MPQLAANHSAVPAHHWHGVFWQEVVDDPSGNKMLLVMDYMEGGPVMTRDALERGRCIPEPLALQYFRDMCKVTTCTFCHAGCQALPRCTIVLFAVALASVCTDLRVTEATIHVLVLVKLLVHAALHVQQLPVVPRSCTIHACRHAASQSCMPDLYLCCNWV